MHAYPHRNKFDLSAWRTGTVRSGVIHLMHEMGAHEMISGYGLTEGYGHSCDTDARAPLATKMRNAGKPLTGVEIKITDPDTQQTLPSGTAGEILLRGYITPGYYKNPERTRETIDAEGWFHTGDVGVLEEDGSLTFRGRYKELIKTGGINVVPVDVEDVLHSHPRVRQAVVVGLPDKERDEIVAAMVVAHPGQTIDMKDLLAHCKKSAAAFKIPRYVLIVKDDEVPLTDTGKVHRGKTQEILEKHYLASKSTA
jgi:fatty-acyl-CoA synthase